MYTCDVSTILGSHVSYKERFSFQACSVSTSTDIIKWMSCFGLTSRERIHIPPNGKFGISSSTQKCQLQAGVPGSGVRSRGDFKKKTTKHQGVSLSICTSSGITRNLKSLYQRRCDPKIKQKKKTVPPSIPSPCSDLLALPPRLFHTSHLGNPFIRRPFWRSHLRRGLRQCHCSKPHGLLLRGGPLLVISRVMIPKNGLIMD